MAYENDLRRESWTLAMTGDRRERKRQHMASHLSATAFKLFEAHGYDAVSMEQIAADADVAKATLYNYFPVKEALIAHRFREDIASGMAERAAALDNYPTFDARMRYLLTESAAWHSQRKAYLPHYVRFLTGQSHHVTNAAQAKTGHSDTRQILTALFLAAQQSGEVATRQTAAQIAGSFEYLLFGAVTAWLCDPSQPLAARFIAAFDLAMYGVATASQKNSPDRLPGAENDPRT
jgi:AcrR family transcriptional regulator